MAIVYRIYSNGGNGGAVDYATPVASTTSLSLTLGPLPPATDTTFAVRACDADSELEEANTDAFVRVILEADGRDVSGRPGPPSDVVVESSPGGGLRVSWSYRAPAEAGPPQGFLVGYGPAAGGPGPEGSVTVGYEPGRPGYTTAVPGPLPFGAYAVSVRAFNAASLDGGGGVAAGVAGLDPAALRMEPVSARVVSAGPGENTTPSS